MCAFPAHGGGRRAEMAPRLTCGSPAIDNHWFRGATEDEGGFMSAQGKRVVIVAAQFNEALVEAMIEAARDEVTAGGAALVRVVRVPGSYEVPLVADRLMAQDGVDALVVLGYIERGETQHGEVMGHVVHGALVQLQLTYHKPVGVGIIGPGATAEQAEIRKDDYARAAARAAMRLSQVLDEIGR
jgi:6,7-dimethyl-8-ribityllumazine synthase